MEHKSDGNTKCNWRAQYSHQRISTGIEGLGNKRTSGDYPNDSIVEIYQNTDESPGDLRRFAVTETSVKDHRLTLL